MVIKKIYIVFLTSVAGNSSPIQCILAFFDPLLCCSAFVVRFKHITGFPVKVSKTESWAVNSTHSVNQGLAFLIRSMLSV